MSLHTGPYIAMVHIGVSVPVYVADESENAQYQAEKLANEIAEFLGGDAVEADDSPQDLIVRGEKGTLVFPLQCDLFPARPPKIDPEDFDVPDTFPEEWA